MLHDFQPHAIFGLMGLRTVAASIVSNNHLSGGDGKIEGDVDIRSPAVLDRILKRFLHDTKEMGRRLNGERKRFATQLEVALDLVKTARV